MAFKFSYSPAEEADRRLLPYKTYDDYLDSLVQVVDLRNLRSTLVARMVAALGYRTTGECFSKQQFVKRRAVIEEVVRPTVRPYKCASEGLTLTEPLAQALAEREKANRLEQLNTIIFLRLRNKMGYEVSGYIDFQERLMCEDWAPFFRGEVKLKPQLTDLSYYHWKSGTITSTPTRNFTAFTDKNRGLLFQNRHDHLIMQVDPVLSPGTNTVRQRVYSNAYRQVELFDHVLRRKT